MHIDAQDPNQETLAGAGPIWNVPFARNANFTGREMELAAIEANFHGADFAARTQSIYGLGGVGKTQLAQEYAYRHRHEYAVVWWVRADETSTMLGDFMALGKPLFLTGLDVQPLDLMCESIRRALEQRSAWLLVLDNAPGIQAISRILPQSRSGHVLVTSRNPNWRGVGRPLHLAPLKREESLAFLHKRTGLENTAEALELAAALGDLPLALEQAGACIEQSRITFADYLAHFRKHRLELLRVTRPRADYPETVATTWELAFARVRGASRTADELLNLISFLGPDGVEKSMLSKGARNIPYPLRTTLSDPAAFDGAVAALLTYSLIDANGPWLSLHRLVADVTRDRLPSEERKRWCEVALRLVNDAFAFESADVGTWGRCAALMPHVFAIAGHAETLQVTPELLAGLLNETGRFLLTEANYADARAVLARALEQARSVHGDKHPAVSAIVNNLGRVCQRQQDYESARHYFEWALAIDEPAFGQEHPHVATVMNNYGLCLMATGNAQAAREHFEWALQVYVKHYGHAHPRTASIINNLGFALKALGDLMNAGECFSRALDVVEKTAGPKHPNVASILFNLGATLRGLGKHAMARPYLERARSITQSAFSPTHPDVVRDVDQLGIVLKELGDFDSARRLYEQQLHLVQRVAGPDHPLSASLQKALEDLGVASM